MNFGYSLDNSDIGRDQRIGQTSVPWTDALEATAQGTWFGNGSQYASTAEDTYFAQHPEWRQPAASMAGALTAIPGIGGFAAPVAMSAYKAMAQPPSADEFIDAHSLNQQYGESLGLSFDQPQRRGAVDILVNNRKQTLQRDYVLAHAPTSTAYKAASFLTSLAVSAADPLNVAAAFVPVVGEARYALWAERFGSTLARVGQGAVEGAVGTAALQPIQAASAYELHDEYSAADAFWNVAFGSVLGGGLHAGVGKVSDLLESLHPDTREAALRSAVGQAAEGRSIDVSPVLSSDPKLAEYGDEFDRLSSAPAPAEETPRAPDPAIYDQAMRDLAMGDSTRARDTTLGGRIKQLGGIRTKTPDGKLTSEGGDLMEVIGDNRGHVMNLVNNTREGTGKVIGQAPDNLLSRLKEERWLPEDATISDLYDALGRQVGGEHIYHPESDAHADEQYRSILRREFSEAGISSKDARADAAQKLAAFRESEQGQEFARGEHDRLAAEEDEVLKSHGYEPGADYGAEFDLDREPQTAGRFGASQEGQQPGAERHGNRQAAVRAAGGSDEVSTRYDGDLSRARENALSNDPSPATSPAASAQAERDVRAGIGDNADDELRSALDQIDAYEKQGVLAPEQVAQARGGSEDIKKAEQHGEAAKSAARCLLLHP